jgi:mono/diheme cytochrome c family protein
MRSGSIAKSLCKICVFSSVVVGCNSDEEPGSANQSVTYYEHALPIFEHHCLGCHQEGGIGQFSLGDYPTAQARAASIRAHTQARTMPPWGVTSDGSCGNFSDSLALSDAQIQTLAAWVQAGAPKGTPRAVRSPELPSLDATTTLETPNFLPRVEGSALAEYDEYRCFLFDAPSDGGFITGYNVLPGNSRIVHHALAILVDPEAPSQLNDGSTNLDQMLALDAESPDREGWPCFGLAGETVAPSAVPLVWAPGQGVVRYPNESGVPLKGTDKIVVQIHYNLANPDHRGEMDQTQIQLRIAPDVPNVGVFVLDDPLLDSLDDEMPDTLPAGRASYKYSWKHSLAQMGLGDLPSLELHGIMPHMHELGQKYRFGLTVGSAKETCAAQIERWDFHWQRMYFYSQPYAVTPTSQFQVTCDYDTSSVIEDVLPGWGTKNEMCLATLYFTVPRAALESP